MQWVLDIWTDWLYANGIYRDRGPAVPNDFDQGDLTQDDAWHELDLSSIVPENAKCILLHFRGSDAAVGRVMYIRPAGDTTGIGTCFARNQVSNIAIGGFLPMGVSSDRKIEYRSVAPGFALFNFKIRGWWL